MRSTLKHSSAGQLRRHPAAQWGPRRGFERAAQAVTARARQAGRRTGDAAIDTHVASIDAPVADATLQRALAAGGPVDVASYSCHCGLIFSAAVSTTVSCPHCGAEQDW